MSDATMPELNHCQECGMPCAFDEYHPFAACLMFKACHNSETVRANLGAVKSRADLVPHPPNGDEVGEAVTDDVRRAIGRIKMPAIENHVVPIEKGDFVSVITGLMNQRGNILRDARLLAATVERQADELGRVRECSGIIVEGLNRLPAFSDNRRSLIRTAIQAVESLGKEGD